jgi:hypothetical protein
MLQDLENTHRELLQAADALEVQTSRKVPDPMALGRARLAICKGESRRFQLLEQRIYPMLLDRGTDAEVELLLDLRSSSREMRVATSEFVAGWSMGRALAHWDSYRSGSALLQATLRRRLAAEEALLNPLVARLHPKLLASAA